jgi:hypothetical protein
MCQHKETSTHTHSAVGLAPCKDTGTMQVIQMIEIMLVQWCALQLCCMHTVPRNLHATAEFGGEHTSTCLKPVLVSLLLLQGLPAKEVNSLDHVATVSHGECPCLSFGLWCFAVLCCKARWVCCC